MPIVIVFADTHSIGGRCVFATHFQMKFCAHHYSKAKALSRRGFCAHNLLFYLQHPIIEPLPNHSTPPAQSFMRETLFSPVFICFPLSMKRTTFVNPYQNGPDSVIARFHTLAPQTKDIPASAAIPF
jgi:hypothetical protein